MTYTKWTQTPLPTRMQIATMLGIKKLRPTHVANNEVVDDGYNFKDIEASMTIEKLQELTKSTLTNLGDLFDLLVDEIHNPSPKIPDQIYTPVSVPLEEVKPKTNGKGKAKK